MTPQEKSSSFNDLVAEAIREGRQQVRDNPNYDLVPLWRTTVEKLAGIIDLNHRHDPSCSTEVLMSHLRGSSFSYESFFARVHYRPRG